MADAEPIDFNDLQAVADSGGIRPTSANEPLTLMEIAEFPRWENVYSKILGFLLDIREAHGFGPFFIRSMVAAYPERCHSDRGTNAPALESVDATDNVEREAGTKTGKRIDAVIECADFLVCIENNISSGLQNDLGEYRARCETRSDGRPVVGIVLSPRLVTSQSLGEDRFVSITYSDLIDEEQQRMRHFIGPHNTRYQYLLFDFLQQADRLARTYRAIRNPSNKLASHHQWLTLELAQAQAQLQWHVWAVIALMRVAPNWNVFRRHLNRAFPKQNHTVPLALTDQDE